MIVLLMSILGHKELMGNRARLLRAAPARRGVSRARHRHLLVTVFTVALLLADRAIADPVCSQCRACAEHVLHLPHVPSGKIAPPMSARARAARGMRPASAAAPAFEVVVSGTTQRGYCIVRHPQHTWYTFWLPKGPLGPQADIISWSRMQDVATRFIAAAAPTEARSLMALRTADSIPSEGALKLRFSASVTVNVVRVWLPYTIGMTIGMDNGLISAASMSDTSSLRRVLRARPSSQVITDAISAGSAAIQLPQSDVAPVRELVWAGDDKTARWQLLVIPSKASLARGCPLRWAGVYVDARHVVQVQSRCAPTGANAQTRRLLRSRLEKASAPPDSPSVEALRLLHLAAAQARGG